MFRTTMLCLILCLIQASLAADPVQLNAGDFPFRDPTLSWDARADDLVSRLTVDEMIDMMALGGGAYRKPNPAIPRLGLKPFNFDTECLRGVVAMPSTSFPQSIGLAASFSRLTVTDMAYSVGLEARAFYNNASKYGDYGNMKSISCLAPFINIVHHPLWGRIQEVYGEDPFLSGAIAAAYVHGLQGSHPRYVLANSGCKVVDVHSGPENIPVSRMSFNAVVTERDMRLTFLPNFKTCIEAGTYNLMCSYNSINGTPACANKWLLNDILRKEFGFRGYYISDEGAIENIFTEHHYVNSSIEAAVAAAKAGVNLELPPASHPAYLQLHDAVKQDLISPDEIEELVRPLLYTRLRLGEFDPSYMNPYNVIDLSVVQSEAHRNLAIDAAIQTFVLLKNYRNALPVKLGFHTLGIVGPMANNLPQLYGNYQSTIVPEFAKTVLQGLLNVAGELNVAQGCSNNHCTDYDGATVQAVIKSAEVIVACIGTGIELEHEGDDRATMELPTGQQQLLKDLDTYGVNKTVIVLVFSGGPVDVSIAKYSRTIQAILQCFFPSQSTGEAVRQVLFEGSDGSVQSPAARLPYTWYANLEQAGNITDYSMNGKTYRYYKGPGDPLYPFGYGLSYTSFSYSDLVLNSTFIRAGEGLKVSVKVTNMGKYSADEVVQVYISWQNPPVAMPTMQLVAFDRFMVRANSTMTAELTIAAHSLQIWDDKEGWIDDIDDTIIIYVGGQQPNQATRATSNVIDTKILILK